MWTRMRIFVLLAALFVASDAYSKYGRTCKDIGCRPNEVCVMAEDPCTGQSDSCGRYPTCSRSSDSCTTMVCPGGQYCKTENGRPTCVSKDHGTGFDSAGVSSVNGQQVPGSRQPNVPADPSNGSRYESSNPYANANAPPAEEVNNNNGHPSYNNPAYPPYPTTNNNNNNGYPPYPTNNNGYPPYPNGAGYQPGNNNNNGYPSYPPNNNRPAVAVDQYGYPIYPSTQRPDNRHYPQHNLPQHNTGWGNTYPNTIYRKNGASAHNSFSIIVVLAVAMVLSTMSGGIFKA